MTAIILTIAIVVATKILVTLTIVIVVTEAWHRECGNSETASY